MSPRRSVTALSRHIIANVLTQSGIIDDRNRQEPACFNNPAWSYVMSWDQTFAAQIDLPNGAVATTLRDAIGYIDELSEAERETSEWKNARDAIAQAADEIGSIWFARIAVVRAIQMNGLETKHAKNELV